MSKTKMVKEHLKNHKTIDTWQAITLYRATRLSGIIYSLKRRHGMKIHSTEHNEEFATYTLVEE